MNADGTASISRELGPDFELGDPTLDPRPRPIGTREAFYYLTNIDEHPEVLPLARALTVERLVQPRSGARPPEGFPPWPHDPDGLDVALEALSAWAERFRRPWHQVAVDVTRRQTLHWFGQFLPMALVDGCWLQCAPRVSTAHTRVGAQLTLVYGHQVRAFMEDPGRHFVGDYRAVYERLGAPLPDVCSRSFADRGELLEASFELPNLLLGIAQFPRTCLPEIIGINLGWQYMHLTGFGPALIQDVCSAYGLPPLGDDLSPPEYLQRARELAREVAITYLDTHSEPSLQEAWDRVGRGLATAASAWSTWFEAVECSAPWGPPDPTQEMIDLLRRKAPHAQGYHAEKALNGRRIDEHLDPASFDGPALLAALAQSPWVKKGSSDKSALVKGLVQFGGPMLAVFSPVELDIMRRWIDGLSDAGETPTAPASISATGQTGPEAEARPARSRPTWTSADLKRRSQARFANCSVRDLYHHLVNVEFYPDILPVAAQFARDRLERSMAMLTRGPRPIPSRRYDPAALERWVYAKHREQIDSYRAPDARPPVPKEAFVESTVQLAPVILIDGGWLQGMACPPLIHSVVGRMLFHVFIEEVGEGKASEHHANIYRDLLAAMGEHAPPVETKEFAHWSRLRDSSFEVPALWLSMSCFPRHFMPEILGLNLAVELAGIGGPYMEARDALRGFGWPTLFVEVHNAADNVSYGHAAWAMNAIKRYMDELAGREGPHNLDHAWQRVWTGLRSTLPQIGRIRLAADRIGRYLFGAQLPRVPLIFPS